MDLKSKHLDTIKGQREQRREWVVSAALDLFLEQGIEQTTMADAAERAEIGVASVYRYFKTKTDLAIEAAILLWRFEIQTLKESVINEAKGKLTGYESVREALGVFLELYEQHGSFLIFLQEFDSLMVREQVASERLAEYEAIILSLKAQILGMIEAGQEDGSIRGDLDGSLFYDTAAHALMSLSQKLLTRGRIISSDHKAAERAQLTLLYHMMMDYLGGKGANGSI